VSASTTRPAGRVLHVCYCCDDADGVTRLFVDGLGMRNTMRTDGARDSGAILGIDRDIEVIASFVYDSRGPRVSPAVEVQGWIDPPLEGVPAVDPNHVGVRALGVAVSDLDGAIAQLSQFGYQPIGRSGTTPFGAPAAVLRDPNGVTLDVVAAADVPDGESRMRHLRVTCSDLARSRAWYEGLGFAAVDAGVTVEDGTLFGIAEPVKASFLRLRLPEEPFEVVLSEWATPPSMGAHYAEPNHAGLYRAALRVEDTRASYEAMADAGWAFDREPMLIALNGTPVPDMWITFTSDPDGVPYELVQRPVSAFR
jgi:catechol 2,3-dioxygenase-like lactoylglutathione lyase family enzyme